MSNYISLGRSVKPSGLAINCELLEDDVVEPVCLCKVGCGFTCVSREAESGGSPLITDP